MNKVIIHPDASGNVLATFMAPGYDPVEEAAKICGSGPYHIIDATALPADLSQQQAWEFVDDPVNPIHVNTSKIIMPPLADVLGAALDHVIATLIQDHSLPAGTATEVMKAKVALAELAKYAPEQVFASEAKAVISGWPTLPSEAEAVRQSLLAAIAAKYPTI